MPCDWWRFLRLLHAAGRSVLVCAGRCGGQRTTSRPTGRDAARNLRRQRASEATRQQKAISHANDTLVRRAIAARFATAVYAALSPDGKLTYCNAGHNPPLVVGKCGVRRLETGGIVVGVFEQACFDEQTLQLEPGDVLVAYSDGLTEARNLDGEEFGEERLMTCVRANCDLAPTKLLECVFDAVDKTLAHRRHMPRPCDPSPSGLRFVPPESQRWRSPRPGRRRSRRQG